MASADNVIKGLGYMTESLKNVQAPAKQMTLMNAPLLLIGSGPWPAVIAGLTAAVTTATSNSCALRGATTDNYDDSADAIVAALKDYVTTAQETLNILIGKAGLTKQVPFAAPPMAAVLRAIEASDDAVVAAIIDKTPSKQDQLAALGNSVDATQAQAVDAYSLPLV